jgi:hypothetical protein
MQITDAIIKEVIRICSNTQVATDHAPLLQILSQHYPGLSFTHVLTRDGWHRTGGILDSTGARISDNLREWVETKSGGDVNKLMAQYADSGYIATRLNGKTHYFAAQTGKTAQEFVQLEVEELQEMVDHVMFGKDILADDIQDIIEPADAEKLKPEPIGLPCYLFRRMTAINEFMQSMAAQLAERGKTNIPALRFMQDWDRGSSKDAGSFCEYWVLALQQYNDAWGETIMSVKPVSTFTSDLNLIKLNGEHRGAGLANLIHNFDHSIGYPMAWYFFMLSHSEVPYQLAEAIHKDLMGAYDYLPAKDLKVLNDWSAKPYSV